MLIPQNLNWNHDGHVLEKPTFFQDLFASLQWDCQEDKDPGPYTDSVKEFLESWGKI